MLPSPNNVNIFFLGDKKAQKKLKQESTPKKPQAAVAPKEPPIPTSSIDGEFIFVTLSRRVLRPHSNQTNSNSSQAWLKSTSSSLTWA